MDVAADFAAARTDDHRVVLEGFHAIKHAVRFGAEIVTAIRAQGKDAPTDLAPDLAAWLASHVRTVDRAVFERAVPHPHPTGLAAVAVRPTSPPWRELPSKPRVILDGPRRPGNVGAAIRIAAAAGAAAVAVRGDIDPWSPAAVRGAAGLQFAVPIYRHLPDLSGPVWALDPDGDQLSGTIPDSVDLVFGSERSGVSAELLDRADRRVALPMTPGVSSINLAASVAAVLYVWRTAASVGDGGDG